MAPTISRQWRGGPADYAALCDYCDVRYLRSQLTRQSNGRLACIGPATNGCGAGLDEVALDKINADKMRNRRRPTKHRGGRFDQMRVSIEEIFGASLRDYWDATKNLTAASDGTVTSWTSVKLGAGFEPVDPRWVAHWHASVPELSGRPAVQVMGSPFGSPFFVSSQAPFLLAEQRPYVGIVQSLPPSDALAPGSISFGSYSEPDASVDAGYDPPQAGYTSTLGVLGLSIPRDEVGTKAMGRLYEMDGTGPFAFRAGSAEARSSADAPVKFAWEHVFLWAGGALTLLVIANAPTPTQIAEFQALGRSYAVKLP